MTRTPAVPGMWPFAKRCDEEFLHSAVVVGSSAVQTSSDSSLLSPAGSLDSPLPAKTPGHSRDCYLTPDVQKVNVRATFSSWARLTFVPVKSTRSTARMFDPMFIFRRH